MGAGVMGTSHARVASNLRNCDVAWVVDPDLERAEALAKAVGGRSAATVGEVIGKVDAAVLAVPTTMHTVLGVPLLKAGVSCLVEKPLALDIKGADELIDAAASSGAVLAVGHVERHNPAVLELDHIVADVVHVAAERISVFSPRVTDDVVLDLMIHDLDIVATLVGEEPEVVHAVGRRMRTVTHDLAVAVLEFPSGVTASVTASRLGQQKIRQLSITQTDAFINVDLVVPNITISRVHHSEFVDDDGTRYRQTGVVEIPYLVHRGEPLALEIEDFVRAVVDRVPPRVGGQDGKRAVVMANQVLEALVSN